MSERAMDLRTEVSKAMLADLEKTPANGGEHGCLFDVSPDFNMNIRGHVDLRALADAAIAVATKSSAAYIERLEAAIDDLQIHAVRVGANVMIPATEFDQAIARSALQTGGA